MYFDCRLAQHTARMLWCNDSAKVNSLYGNFIQNRRRRSRLKARIFSFQLFGTVSQKHLTARHFDTYTDPESDERRWLLCLNTEFRCKVILQNVALLR